MNERIAVNYLNKPCYDIVLTDSFDDLSSEIEALNLMCAKVVIVSDSNVDPLYGDMVEKGLDSLGFSCFRFTFKAGENSKNLDTVRNLYGYLIEKKVSRNDLLLALGGGVVGDLCGFAAATYLRGIAYIQLPTTLLAQVDSSIGGKTGVDFDGFKNMVGAFYMPRLVYINIKTLETLDGRHYFSGFAEVMKHGLIRDASYYEWLLEHMDEICEREAATVLSMIQHSLIIKKMIVEKDPHERGSRMLLNFGHTIGHALEKAFDFKLMHGECVALGSVAEAFISWKKGFIKMEEYYEIRDMFVPFNLPISITGTPTKKVLEFTKSDKKVMGESHRFVLLKKIGRAFVDSSVTDDDILGAIEEITWKEE